MQTTLQLPILGRLLGPQRTPHQELSAFALEARAEAQRLGGALHYTRSASGRITKIRARHPASHGTAIYTSIRRALEYVQDCAATNPS